MASSSHYGYSSTSRYLEAFQPGQDNNRHLYANFAPWQGLQGVPPAAGPASDYSSSLQHRLPTSYYHQSGPVVYSNHQPFEAAWPPASSYHPAWNGSLGPTPLASRATVPQTQRAAGSSVPHFYEHQQTSNRSVSASHEAQNALQTVELATNECIVRPDAPPCPPAAPKGAPVAHILNDPLPPSLQPRFQHLATQSSIWPTGTVTTLANADHSNVTYGTYPVASSPDTFSGSPWSEINEAGRASASPPYELESDWTLVQRPTEPRIIGHGLHDPRTAPLGSSTRRLDAVPVGAAQKRRRAAQRPKLPTIPSAFTKRQEKSPSSISRRGGQLSQEAKDNAALNRKLARVCIRCKFYKRLCVHGDGPCTSCIQASQAARVWKLGCYQGQIEAACLDRRCHGRFDQSEAEYINYPFVHGSPMVPAQVVWNLPGYGPIPARRPLQVWVQQYHPDPDSGYTEWKNIDGQVNHIRHPHVAAFDTAATQQTVREYFEHNLPEPRQWIISRNPHDELAIQVYNEIWRLWHVFANEGAPASSTLWPDKALSNRDVAELIRNILSLQNLTLLRQGYGAVVSDNAGCEEVDFARLGRSHYEAYNRDGYQRMLPAAINHQFDVMIHKWSQEIEGKILAAMKNLFFKKSRGTKLLRWYELFLCLFLLFYHLGYLRGSSEDYMASKEGTSHSRSANKQVTKQLEAWGFTHEVYMEHYKATLRDLRPFVLARENPEELRINGAFPDAESFNSFMRMFSITDRTGPSHYIPPRSDVGQVPCSLDNPLIRDLLRVMDA